MICFFLSGTEYIIWFVICDSPIWFLLLPFRYGPIFRTNLVGRPVVISTDSDLNYFIFQQEGRLFKSWYPDTFTEIFGRQNVGSLHGFMYKYLKNMVLNLFGPESLKKMLPEVEFAACRKLERWSSQCTVELKEASASVSSLVSHLSSIIQRHIFFLIVLSCRWYSIWQQRS